MAEKQAILVASTDRNIFNDGLNDELASIEKNLFDVVDIKFSVSTDETGPFYSALIIYEVV